VVRHTCFNGIVRPCNHAHPCTSTHHLRLGSKLENLQDVGIELGFLRAKSIFDLVGHVGLYCDPTGIKDAPHLGIVPVSEVLYNFTVHELCTMRKHVELVYPMTGFKAYFLDFDEVSRPHASLHPSNGRWTDLAETRLARLMACYYRTASSGRFVRRIRYNWERIEAFTKNYPALLPEYSQTKYAMRIKIIRKKHSEMSMESFMKHLSNYDDQMEGDPRFDKALEEFEEGG
jgi:hypothetical protein